MDKAPQLNLHHKRTVGYPSLVRHQEDSRLNSINCSVTTASDKNFASDKNLALFPFSALLPKLSDISELIGMKGHLKQRQKDLLETRNAAKTQGSKRTAEDFMLNQVFQWLTVVQGQEDEE